MRICLTGGIACGKSLLSRFLERRGVEILDADDIVHSLVPEEERRRLAKTVFRDPQARRELESRLHPIVRARIDEWFSRPAAQGVLKIAVIPLLFEVHWDADYDIIICVASSRESQIGRMMQTRGLARSEAEARIDSQMDVLEKARKSTYAIFNEGSQQQLEEEAARLVAWLERQVKP